MPNERRPRPPAMNGDSVRPIRTDSPKNVEARSNPDRIVVRVRDAGLLVAGRPVLVLLSGGRDSTALLDLAVTISGREQVSVLHVNYRLREAAVEDERHCAELCARLGVQMEVRRPEPRQHGNLQAWARELRYAAAAECSRGSGAEVATGHTASDQVESILMRLASSPSRRALLGMRPRDGQLIRPLFSLTREETTAFCIARGLPWREDATNRSPDFARNRARAGLVPALRELHPAAERNVLALAETLRTEAEVLNELVDGVLGGRAEISLERLRAQPPALRALIVQRLADGVVGRPAPGSARRAEEIAAMGNHAALDLPHGIRAQSRTGVLRFIRRPRAPEAP